jgi:serine/threonine protein kinase
LDAAAARFERAWRCSERPLIEAYLAEVAEPHQPLLLGELIRVELELRRRSAEQPAAEEYRRRFPEYHAIITTIFEGGPASRPRETGDRLAASTFAGSLSGAAPKGSLPPELAAHADYEIIRKLGHGGMGVVYLARNRLILRDEVLKLIDEEIVRQSGALERFLREIRAVCRLRHPNIVSAYTAFRCGGSLVLAMEYVEGLDLARMVRAKGPMPIRQACYYVHQAALGLQHAHEEGMVHRDIKPGNLMLSFKKDRAVIKLLDFGLAKATSEQPLIEMRAAEATLAEGAFVSLTRTGDMLGTPDFMAPEQIEDAQSADIRADIYSLGCTLYFLLAGCPPFPGLPFPDVLKAHRSTAALPLDVVRPDVPAELAALVARMMAKRPDERFSEPDELVEVLAPFTRGSTTRLNRALTGQAPPTEKMLPPTLAGFEGLGPADKGRPTPLPTAEDRKTELEWMKLIRLSDSEIISPGAAPRVGEAEEDPRAECPDSDSPAAAATACVASPTHTYADHKRSGRLWMAVAGVAVISSCLLVAPTLRRMIMAPRVGVKPDSPPVPKDTPPLPIETPQTKTATVTPLVPIETPQTKTAPATPPVPIETPQTKTVPVTPPPPPKVAASSVADRSNQSVASEPGLIGHWRFDEGTGIVTNNSSGRGHLGLLGDGEGQGEPSWVPSPLGGHALSFDGTDDVVLIADAPDLRPQSLTIEGWVSFRERRDGFCALIGRAVGPGDCDSFSVYCHGNRLCGTVGHFQGDEPYLGHEWMPELGKWYHVALTFDHDTRVLTLLMDGEVVASGIAPRPIGYDRHALVIGAGYEYESLTHHFPGIIDEVRLWDHVRPPAVIKAAVESQRQRMKPEPQDPSAKVAKLRKEPEKPPADDLSAEVDRAIRDGIRYLKQEQRADGSWEEMNQQAKTGTTSLVTLALLTAGEKPDAAYIRRALDHLRRFGPNELRSTYAIALQTMVFAAAEPERDQFRIAANVDWLQRAQIKPTDSTDRAGLWTYTEVPSGGDNSNTQYALSGLEAASEVGVPVKREVWALARLYWEQAQRRDGGWGYHAGDPISTASMTCAGISSLIITGSKRIQGQEYLRGSLIHNCGQVSVNRNLQGGVDWLAANFTVGQNFPMGQQWKLYYLYGLERAGRLAGVRFFGKCDWYRRGADELVKTQDRLSGFWRGVTESPVVSTSFALLFLAKGRAPVLINKLRHDQRDDWNNDPDDARNLTSLVSRDWKSMLNWQVVDPSTATAADLMQAPIALMNGHQAPALIDSARHSLREYIEQGGFLLADACCGQSKFDQGFRKLMRELFPGKDEELAPLPDTHPIWKAKHMLEPKMHPLWGIQRGGRTVVVYSQRDLSCYWNQARLAPNNATVLAAAKLGQNIVDYATGRAIPRDKLSRLPDKR